MFKFVLFFICRVVLVIDQKSLGGYIVQNVVIHTYGCAQVGVKQRQDGAR